MKPAAYTAFSLSVHVPDDFTAEQLEAVRRRLSHYDLSGILHGAALTAAGESSVRVEVKQKRTASFTVGLE